MTIVDVANCQEVGIVTTQTQSRVVINRSPSKVTEELTILARNRAADLGADAIVPIGVPSNGEQSFRAYRCSP